MTPNKKAPERITQEFCDYDGAQSYKQKYIRLDTYDDLKAKVLALRPRHHADCDCDVCKLKAEVGKQSP